MFGGGILSVVAGGLVIAPFVIGAMLPLRLIDRETVPMAAGTMIVSMLFGLVASFGPWGEDVLGADLKRWAWVVPVAGFPSGYGFGRLCKSSLEH